jgi:hypothetical protein
LYTIKTHLDSDVKCTLQDVLMFFIAEASIPRLGFDEQPSIFFLNDEILPSASTCDLILRLPICHDNYGSFKESMLLGFLGNDGFGNL